MIDVPSLRRPGCHGLALLPMHFAGVQTRIGSIAFYLGSFKTRLEICKDENGESRYIGAIQGHSGGNNYFTKTDELRDDSLQMETIHLPRGSSTRPILFC